MRGALYEARLELQRALERLEGRPRAVTRRARRVLGVERTALGVPEGLNVVPPVQLESPSDSGPVEVPAAVPDVTADTSEAEHKVSLWARVWAAMGGGNRKRQ